MQGAGRRRRIPAGPTRPRRPHGLFAEQSTSGDLQRRRNSLGLKRRRFSGAVDGFADTLLSQLVEIPGSDCALDSFLNFAKRRESCDVWDFVPGLARLPDPNHNL
jgi:hypothetical protein